MCHKQYVSVPGLYWADAARISPVPAQYWHVPACLQGYCLCGLWFMYHVFLFGLLYWWLGITVCVIYLLDKPTYLQLKYLSRRCDVLAGRDKTWSIWVSKLNVCIRYIMLYMRTKFLQCVCDCVLTKWDVRWRTSSYDQFGVWQRRPGPIGRAGCNNQS